MGKTFPYYIHASIRHTHNRKPSKWQDTVNEKSNIKYEYTGWNMSTPWQQFCGRILEPSQWLPFRAIVEADYPLLWSAKLSVIGCVGSPPMAMGSQAAGITQPNSEEDVLQSTLPRRAACRTDWRTDGYLRLDRKEQVFAQVKSMWRTGEREGEITEMNAFVTLRRLDILPLRYKHRYMQQALFAWMESKPVMRWLFWDQLHKRSYKENAQCAPQLKTQVCEIRNVKLCEEC